MTLLPQHRSWLANVGRGASDTRRLSTRHPIELNRTQPLPVAIAAEDTRPVADSREPCFRCQTRGDLGCAHFQPFGGKAAAELLRGKVAPRPRSFGRTA